MREDLFENFFEDVASRAPGIRETYEKMKNMAPEDTMHEALEGLRLIMKELYPAVSQQATYALLALSAPHAKERRDEVRELFTEFQKAAAHPSRRDNVLGILAASILWLDYFLYVAIKPVSERDHILVPTKKEKREDAEYS